jgi:hypothetical protein
MFGRTPAYTRHNEDAHARVEAICRAEGRDLHEMSTGGRIPLDTVIAEIFSILDQIGSIEVPPTESPESTTDSEVICL